MQKLLVKRQAFWEGGGGVGEGRWDNDGGSTMAAHKFSKIDKARKKEREKREECIILRFILFFSPFFILMLILQLI